MKTITKISIHRKDDSPIFGESVIEVGLEDQAGGPYLILTSHQDDERENKIALDWDEFDEVIEAVKILRNQDAIREENSKSDKYSTPGSGEE